VEVLNSLNYDWAVTWTKSNRRIKVLQAFALPLDYHAIKNKAMEFIYAFDGQRFSMHYLSFFFWSKKTTADKIPFIDNAPQIAGSL
jgi:hypothetical protein